MKKHPVLKVKQSLPSGPPACEGLSIARSLILLTSRWTLSYRPPKTTVLTPIHSTWPGLLCSVLGMTDLHGMLLLSRWDHLLRAKTWQNHPDYFQENFEPFPGREEALGLFWLQLQIPVCVPEQPAVWLPVWDNQWDLLRVPSGSKCQWEEGQEAPGLAAGGGYRSGNVFITNNKLLKIFWQSQQCLTVQSWVSMRSCGTMQGWSLTRR